MRLLRKNALSIYLMTALCGSASVHAASQQVVPGPVPQAEANSSIPGQDIPAVWWQLFQSRQIDTLLKRAIKTHPDTETAQAALHKAQAYTSAYHGFFYPAVAEDVMPESDQLAGSADGDSPQSHVAASGTDPAASVSQIPAYYGFRAASLKVAYEPDIFSLKSGEVDMPRNHAGVKQMQLEAAYITLASNTVAAAIQQASLMAQIEAQLRIVSLNQHALEIVRNQLKLGYVTEKEVTKQEMTSARAQQQLTPLQQQLEQTRDLLRILAGPDQDAEGTDMTERDVEDVFSLENLHLLQDLPASLQSRLVELRPDVRVALARLNYTSGQYGVAIAHTMPQFTVTASKEGMDSYSTWLARSGGAFFQKKDVAQAVFESRALRSRPFAAKQELTQAAMQYRSVVAAALQNVADALRAIKNGDRELKAAEKAAQKATSLGDQTREQYQSGAVDFQNLLVVQQNEQLAAIKLIQAQTTQLGNTAVLFQALGGGWWGNGNTGRQQAKHP